MTMITDVVINSDKFREHCLNANKLWTKNGQFWNKI